MSNYWLGVAGNLDRVRGNETKTFWCLPMVAQKDDVVLFYFPRAISFADHGLFAEGIVTSLPSLRSLDNPCGGYGQRDNLGVLRHAAVTITKRSRPALAAKDIKADPQLVRTRLVRRNFQGTTFPIDEATYRQLVVLADAKVKAAASANPRMRVRAIRVEQ